MSKCDPISSDSFLVHLWPAIFVGLVQTLHVSTVCDWGAPVRFSSKHMNLCSWGVAPLLFPSIRPKRFAPQVDQQSVEPGDQEPGRRTRHDCIKIGRCMGSNKRLCIRTYSGPPDRAFSARAPAKKTVGLAARFALFCWRLCRLAGGDGHFQRGRL